MSGIMSMLLGAVSSAAAAVDEFFNRVTLLLPGDGTNGAQNNTFLDSSTNNFTITRNGNTTQGTFSPFSQTGWSNYFDGTGDYLSVANNAALNVGSGDFCIEAWFNVSTVASQQSIVSNAGASGSDNTQIDIVSGNIRFASSATVWLTGSAVTTNTWNHVVVSRSGTTMSLFLNGSRQATATNSTNFANANNYATIVGGYPPSTAQFTGYISNVRIVKGSSVYDPTQTTLTVPTAPLTAITNTSLLTCQSNRFIDNSTNAFAITRNGDASVQAFSPFAPTAAYSAATVGGSGYFDGTGDYLSTPDNAAFDLGTGDFTFECWLYKPNNNDVSMICSAANGIDFAYVSGSLRMGRYPVAWDVTELYTIPQNAWTHIAFVKASGRTYLFANGTLLNAGGTANTNSYDVTTTLFIGIAGDTTSRILTGYMAGVRLIKGQALATASFTPPTAPVTTSAVGWTGAASSITGTVSLLLNYTNAGITDATAKNDLETVGNAQISTTQSKFGGSSMSFDGTGDWLLVPHNVDQMFGTGAFTVEFWIYLNATGAARGLVAKGTGTTGWLVSLDSSNRVVFTYTTSTITSTGTISGTTWAHIAVVREGTGTNQTKIYINGTNDGTATVSTDFNQTNSMYVGADRTGGSALNGYIDDLRITKGYARYTANFTAPTSAFALQ